MFIAMNRFQVVVGKENDFEEVWRSRETFLDQVPGFVSFNLLKGSVNDAGNQLYASHSVWESREAFENWTQSEAFRKAHANAGGSTKDIYAGPPNLELFEAVL